ncbi:GNAT family N-acetyltransferase [Rhodophyticola sp. CCM32]|uniref:bifunctional helix-turn-helix transcriptional regulator/GNAT family N-acetyltransferase n=1 Tax=Rhodophyticola sp. CCM32 TaxID=2916397 RepID=UPI00107F0BD6|nr:bifunctional helix-turn-helix transcriptional regulator/GNAT family N-acetyltransferase [Rhodophyticola sp. CCM32]QBY02554.1 GNAT family N-acetyltransferase [Rhodophyticola sp. CCM32]
MNKDDITRVRNFGRSVAVEVGALEDSFLNRGRPLGSARVLNAIGLGYENVADLRAFLKLDTGLLSRLLRGLEAEDLIDTIPNPDDRRSRITHLTAKGKTEFEIYERLSDERAAKILDRHKEARRLLEAMDIVTIALSRDDIVFEEVDYASDIATICLNAFAAELSKRLNLEFDLKKSGDPELSQMKHPHGTFVVARLGDMPVGCVGVKGRGSSSAEIKRMWIAPVARGLGLARRMMSAAEEAAYAMGIRKLRLDTNNTLFEAVGLYRNMGWVEIDRFNDDPYPDLFFEKHLSNP